MRTVWILAGVLMLGGCNDPYNWPHHWNASAANLANIAAQTADWRDLDVGHGDPGSDGQEAAAAVDRLRRGLVKPLANVTASDIAAQSSTAPPAAPVPAAAN